jgi:hypothetical protein
VAEEKEMRESEGTAEGGKEREARGADAGEYSAQLQSPENGTGNQKMQEFDFCLYAYFSLSKSHLTKNSQLSYL